MKTEAPPKVTTPGPYPAPALAFAPNLPERLRKMPSTPIDYDRSLLDERETRVAGKLIEATRVIDEIFLSQVSEENPALRRDLEGAAARNVPLAAEGFAYFKINKGPWDRLKEDEPFIGVKPKPPGAAFYPPDLTKEEFERWVTSHPGDKEAFQELFTVIRRQGDGLVAIPYSRYFNELLTRAAGKLREAAAMHGLGPGIITGPDGEKVDSRLLLKNLYSPIEECKADVLGLWNVLYARARNLPIAYDEETLFATNVGLMFRSMRFGIDEAHGRGNAVQWNFFREKGAILPAEDGRFRVETGKFRGALRDLAAELLMIEATGDFERAKRLLDRYGKATPEIAAVIARLTDIPVDIAPVFVAAGER